MALDTATRLLSPVPHNDLEEWAQLGAELLDLCPADFAQVLSGMREVVEANRILLRDFARLNTLGVSILHRGGKVVHA